MTNIEHVLKHIRALVVTTMVDLSLSNFMTFALETSTFYNCHVRVKYVWELFTYVEDRYTNYR